MSDSIDIILRHLPGQIRAPLERASPMLKKDAREIILRAQRPLVIECADQRYYLTENGILTTMLRRDRLMKTSLSDIQYSFNSICEYSVYARQNELNNGYITIRNGIRVGICGTAVSNHGEIVNLKDISTLSFRIASEALGCSDEILGKVEPLDGVLICGVPCSGKTTLIRDMARRLSERYKVSILDERNEISATCSGVSSYDIGAADVFVGMSKGDGVIRALRSMSPDIIICDELGDRSDVESLQYALRCGVSFIATVHARDIRDLHSRKVTAELLDCGAFRYVVELCDRQRAGQVRKINDLSDGYF